MKRAAPLLMTFAVALFLLPIPLSRSFAARDMVRFMYPLKMLLRERLLSGELPLWTSRLGLGRPLLGGVQAGVVYPLNLLLLLPAPLGIDLLFGVHLFVAAFGMRAWLSTRGEDDIGAATGGVLFALSGYLVSQVAGTGSYAIGAAWIPWVLAAAAAEDPWRAVGGASLALAAPILGGDPQAAFFAGLILLALSLTNERPARALAIAVAALTLGAAVAAVVLEPAIDVTRVGRPGGVPLADALHFALHPVRLLELWWPGAFGEPYSARWFVHALVDEGTGLDYQPWSPGLYLGLATLPLALAALASPVGRRASLTLLAMALVGLLLALGPRTPLFALWHRWLPGARVFRYPEKYFLVTTLCLCALAPRGLAVMTAAPRRAAWVGVGLLALLAGAAALASARGVQLAPALVGRLGGISADDAGRIFAERARASFYIGLIGLGLVGLAARGRLSRRAFAASFGAWMSLDLLLAALPLAGWAPSQIYRTPSPVAEDIHRAAPGEARLYRPRLSDLNGGGPDALMTRATLVPNCGIEAGIGQLDAYDNFHTEPERALWQALSAQPLRLLAVTATHFALAADAQLGRAPSGLVVVARYPGISAQLMSVADPSPRVHLALQTRAAASLDEAARLIAAADYQPGKTAIVEGGEPGDSEGRCDLDQDLPERIRLHCHSSQKSYAIVSDAWFPGWQARVDGRPAPVLRADVALRAIPVGAGDSTVELVYAPRGLTLAALLSLLALGVALALLRRRPRPATNDV